MSGSVDHLHTLPPSARAAVADHVRRLRHDLGKYVSLQVRFLGPGAGPEALREALSTDLLQTRRGPSGSTDALTLWASLRPGLVGEVPLEGAVRVDLSADPDLGEIEAAMAQITAVMPALRAGSISDAEVRQGIDAARRVTDACRAFAARVQGA